MATVSRSSSTLSIDAFYDKQKELYDICGNLINKDKYPFVDILSKYLTDIVELIDIEIKNSARNSMINWREKKNPKLLSKLINNDDNVNLINISMNKITSTNYMNIVNEITEALINDNYRKIPDYSKYLFDIIVKKCMADEAFTKDYIRFLFGFNDSIAKYLNDHINTFITEVGKFLVTNQNLKDYSYFYYVKDIAVFRNVGIILSNMFKLIKSNTIDKNYQIKLDSILLCNNLEEQFAIIFNSLDWLPVNMDELNGRLYMVLGIMELLIDDIWFVFNDKTRSQFNEILTMTYNCASIPNKIKFKVLDLQDMIKNIKINNVVTVTNTSTSTNNKQVLSTIIQDVKNVNIINMNDLVKNIDAFPDNLLPVKPKINVWENRKQTLQVNKSNESNQQELILKQVSESTNITVINGAGDRSEKRHSRDHRRSGRSQSSNRETSAREGSRGKKTKGGDEEIIIRRNMFSGLETTDSHDDEGEFSKTETVQEAENDGFIIVEKKTKNVYKPKKTPALALEGGKIYTGTNKKK
jgi:hypothetical protein